MACAVVDEVWAKTVGSPTILVPAFGLANGGPGGSAWWIAGRPTESHAETTFVVWPFREEGAAAGSSGSQHWAKRRGGDRKVRVRN
jgi:hypothetical protein